MPISGSSREQRARRLDAVEPRRHAHVDEGERVGAALPPAPAAPSPAPLRPDTRSRARSCLVAAPRRPRRTAPRQRVRARRVAAARRPGSCGNPRGSRGCRRRSGCARFGSIEPRRRPTSLMGCSRRCGEKRIAAAAVLAVLDGDAQHEARALARTVAVRREPAVHLPARRWRSCAGRSRGPSSCVVKPWLKIFVRSRRAMPTPLSPPRSRDAAVDLARWRSASCAVRPPRVLERVLRVGDEIHEDLHD